MNNIIRISRRLVVDHVLGRGTELLVPLDDLVHRVQEVLLRDGLAARPNRVHARFRAYAADVSACAVGTKASQELEADVALACHGAGVDLEYLRPVYTTTAEKGLERPLGTADEDHGHSFCSSAAACHLLFGGKEKENLTTRTDVHERQPTCTCIESCAKIDMCTMQHLSV